MTKIDEVEPKFGSWEELVNLLVNGPTHGWIFRGLPNYEYSPVNKLERVLDDAGIPSKEWKDRENQGLAFFKERARIQMEETPADNDLLGWLSFMQHYRAPTRLTDWTVSPLVACYFAYEQVDPNGESAALWMLNAHACRGPFGKSHFPFGRDHMGTVSSETYEDGELVEKEYPGTEITLDDIVEEENHLLRKAIEHEITWPLPLPILRPDERMAAQRACFVCSGKLGIGGGTDSDKNSAVELLMEEASFDEITDRYEGASGLELDRGTVIPQPHMAGVDMEKGEPRALTEFPAHMVKKVELPYAWREKALASLAEMNITADTLFPGLDGIGRTTEVYMQVLMPTSMRDYLGL